MTDTFVMTLNSPITDEQWDAITDVNFDKTDRIWFHTKKGKDVEFAKVIRCKDCAIYRNEDNYCRWLELYVEDDFYCADGKRKEE